MMENVENQVSWPGICPSNGSCDWAIQGTANRQSNKAQWSRFIMPPGQGGFKGTSFVYSVFVFPVKEITHEGEKGEPDYRRTTAPRLPFICISVPYWRDTSLRYPRIREASADSAR